MAINLSNLGSKTKGKKIDPREIFMALPYCCYRLSRGEFLFDVRQMKRRKAYLIHGN